MEQPPRRMHDYGEPPSEVMPRVAPGMHVQPGPLTYLVAAKYVNGQRVVIMHIEHAVGSSIFVLLPEHAKQLADQLTKAATGIEVAH